MSQPPAADLSLNKLLAGAGAAVTSAVIGSFFGVAGTVAGAAIGSVASTIATSLYERSLNTTRDRIRARLNAGGGVDVEERPEPPAPKPWARWVGVTAMVFLLGMLVVTGVEFAKGSSIAGTPGTSVGRVFEPSTAGADTPAADATTTRSTREGRSTTVGATPSPRRGRRPRLRRTRSATPQHLGFRRRVRSRGERHGGIPGPSPALEMDVSGVSPRSNPAGVHFERVRAARLREVGPQTAAVAAGPVPG